jgi:RNA polymerase sigma factor (sigma-70 family)
MTAASRHPDSATDPAILAARAAGGNMRLVRQVTGRLHRSYPWIDRDELASYAYLGLLRAARSFDPERSRSFGAYAAVKGVYHAIDEMRKDGMVRRAGDARQDAQSLRAEVVDPAGQRDMDRLCNRDLSRALLDLLGPDDRKLLMMYYGQSMTFAEIAEVRGVTESAVCMRHGQVIRRLRHQARMRKLVSPTAGTHPDTSPLGASHAPDQQ